MKKTIGGDRLGSGRKMETEIQEYGRSTFNLSFIWRSTMAAGTVVPFLCEIVLPGDTWDMNINNDTKTHPTTGPLFGSFKVQHDMFFAPMRLYNGLLHNNPAGLGLDMTRVKFPYIQLAGYPVGVNTDLEDNDLDNMQINPSCLLAYTGIRGIGLPDVGAAKFRNMNATFILMYWDTIKNYYSNKQEGQLAVLHTPTDTLLETVDFIQGSSSTSGFIAPGGGNTIPLAPAPGLIAFNQPYNFWISWAGDPITDKPIPSQLIFNTSIGNLSLEQLIIGGTPTVDANRYRATYNFNKYGQIDIYNWRYQTASEIGAGKPAIEMFPIENIDEMRTYLMQNTGDTAVMIADGLGGGANLIPYKWLAEWAGDEDVPNMLSSQEGLALKTYQSDQFNNWLDSETIDGTGGINEVTSIAVVDDTFTVEQLIMSNKVYNMLMAINVSGGTYYDWQEVNYGVTPLLGMETPMYLGGLSKELEFQEVVSNSASEAAPLGTLAGKGVMGKKHKGGSVVAKIREAGMLMGLVSITPRIDYSQGNRWYVTLETMDDLHTPWLDGIGFQDLITEKQAWWTTIFDNGPNVWIQSSTGKEPAWMDYRTNFNRTYGNFAITTQEMFMTLNRRYEPEYTQNPDGSYIAAIKDNTTYIDPSKFNFIFAETSLDAQNFWVQIGVNIEARRVMSDRIMPNL